ncbi:MAG: Rha family transcriptional regulator [Acutalibacteraceae bacterium]
MPRKEVIPIIYAIDGKSFPKPPSTCEHTVTQVVTKANRTVGKGALLNKELLAEIGKEHKNLLRDIAGYIKAMKEGAELNKSNGLKIEPVDFFLESTYPDSKGEIRPCCLLTKKGCDMVANKLTGQKGVLFTAAYVTAFEQMRERIKTGKALPDDESRKLRARAMALNAANRSARMLIDAYDSAGIQPSYKVLALTDLYRNEGLKLPTPPLEVDELTYDFTEMAEALGILSEASGKPHAQAVGAIVSTLAIPEQMIVHAPYDRNGHAADYDRYKAPVLDMVRNWLAEHGNPRPIAAKGKKYRVKYAS